MFESLISAEEMRMSEDLGDFFRIKPDNRDLNYSKFFELGDQTVSELSDYNSNNTTQLQTEELVKLLEKQEFVKNFFKG